MTKNGTQNKTTSIDDNLEKEIQEQYNITSDEINSLNESVEEFARTTFNEYNIECGKDEIRLLQNKFMLHALDTMNLADWPPEEDSMLDATTPEDHFRNVMEEMQAGKSEAHTNFSFILGTLISNVDDDSPIYMLANKIAMKGFIQ